VQRNEPVEGQWRTGPSLSRYVVGAGWRGAPPPSAEERAVRQPAIFSAKEIDTNLNQIAHRLNREALALLAGKEEAGDR